MSTNTIAAPESMAMIENTKTMMTMMTLNAAMTDELIDRLRAVLWSVNGEPNANGNVDETVCSEAADCIEALTAERDAAEHLARMRKAFIEEARDERDAAEAERDRMRQALEQIAQWSEAYPTEVFPEPDFAQATAALASSGMSIDAVSASNMRHATKGVGKIARAALKGEAP